MGQRDPLPGKGRRTRNRYMHNEWYDVYLSVISLELSFVWHSGRLRGCVLGGVNDDIKRFLAPPTLRSKEITYQRPLYFEYPKCPGENTVFVKSLCQLSLFISSGSHFILYLIIFSLNGNRK